MLLLLACTNDHPVLPEPAAPLEDSALVDDPLEDVGESGVFNDAVLHDVAITLGGDAYAALSLSPRDWVQGDVTIDGEAVAGVGVRLRGKIGSFRTVEEKPKFKIDFNHFVADQRFQGLEALALNNEVVDCSYLKEPLGYSIFRALGVPAPRASFAQVTVDGEPYGLYVLVEFPDDRFLRRWYDDPSGNLYDGKYIWYGGNDGELVDFTDAYQDNFRLEEGADVALEDIHAVTEGVSRGYAGVDALVNGEELRRFVLAEQWIGHVDGYTLNENNYRVYFNADDGRAEWIPWDLDYGFLNPSLWGKSWKRPVGVVAAACWADDDCNAAYQAEAAEGIAKIDLDAVLADLERWAALTEEAATEDPKRECSASSIQPGRDFLVDWVDGRNDWIRDHWDL